MRKGKQQTTSLMLERSTRGIPLYGSDSSLSEDFGKLLTQEEILFNLASGWLWCCPGPWVRADEAENSPCYVSQMFLNGLHICFMFVFHSAPLIAIRFVWGIRKWERSGLHWIGQQFFEMDGKKAVSSKEKNSLPEQGDEYPGAQSTMNFPCRCPMEMNRRVIGLHPKWIDMPIFDLFISVG